MPGQQKHQKALKRQQRKGKRAKEANRIAWRDRNKGQADAEAAALRQLAAKLGLA